MPNLCILCGRELHDKVCYPISELYQADCSICGKYNSEGLADESIRRLPENKRRLLSAYTRELYENNYPIPNLGYFQDNEINNIISRYQAKTLTDKLNNLILYLGKKSSYFEQPIFVDKEKDYPITFSANQVEFENIRNYADKIGLTFLPPGTGNIALTWAGWEKNELLKAKKILSDKCFVAMHLDPSLDPIYETGMKPALFETNFKPIRIDREEFNEEISEMIIAHIKECKFVIADFTNQRQNVYYEAGFAHGLGRPVIFTCKEEDIANVHFDTRQYKCITWRNALELKTNLINRIKATIWE